MYLCIYIYNTYIKAIKAQSDELLEVTPPLTSSSTNSPRFRVWGLGLQHLRIRAEPALGVRIQG